MSISLQFHNPGTCATHSTGETFPASFDIEHMIDVPPTVIVVHPKERRKKCTVRPLRQFPGFAFCNYPRQPYDLTGYVRLGLGGPLLSKADANLGLLVLDGTWRHVCPMEKQHANIPIRSLPPLITAYPRTSKVSVDPDGGLATIEAIYAAYRLLGRNTTGLMDHYHWAAEFIELNRSFWPISDIDQPDPSREHTSTSEEC